MKAKEFTKPLEEKEIVEIVPAIAATVGRVGAQMGSAAAKAGAKMGTQAMKMGAKTGANLAKGIGKQAVSSIAKAQSNIAKSILKKGNTLTLPQQGGSGEAEFDIDDVSGDSVVLKNPKPPTAYRAIEFWERYNFIHKIESLNAYSLCEAEHLHSGSQFLICNQCGEVTESHICEIPKIIKEKIEKNIFSAKSWNLEVKGICSKCF